MAQQGKNCAAVGRKREDFLKCLLRLVVHSFLLIGSADIDQSHGIAGVEFERFGVFLNREIELPGVIVGFAESRGHERIDRIQVEGLLALGRSLHPLCP